MENMKKYKQEKGAHAPGLPVKWSYFNDMDRIFGNNPRQSVDVENTARMLKSVVKSEEGGCSPVIEVHLSVDLKESEELLQESTCLADEEATPAATSVQVENAPDIHSNSFAMRGKKRRHNSYHSPAKALAGAITKFGELYTQLERDRAEREERRIEREERRQKENADREERILKMQMDMQLRLAELFTLGQSPNRGPPSGEEVKE